MKTHPNDQNPSKVTFKSITFLFATVALIATSSCNKNDKYTNYDLLVEKEWKLTSIERNGAEIGEQCDFDDVLSFENEKDFVPVNEKDFVIIKALKQIINPNNLIEKDVGGKVDTEQVIYKKVKEPEDKSLDTGNVNFKL